MKKFNIFILLIFILSICSCKSLISNNKNPNSQDDNNSSNSSSDDGTGYNISIGGGGSSQEESDTTDTPEESRTGVAYTYENKPEDLRKAYRQCLKGNYTISFKTSTYAEFYFKFDANLSDSSSNNGYFVTDIDPNGLTYFGPYGTTARQYMYTNKWEYLPCKSDIYEYVSAFAGYIHYDYWVFSSSDNLFHSEGNSKYTSSKCTLEIMGEKILLKGTFGTDFIQNKDEVNIPDNIVEVEISNIGTTILEIDAAMEETAQLHIM